jgi:hypothetical protein
MRVWTGGGRSSVRRGWSGSWGSDGVVGETDPGEVVRSGDTDLVS